MSLPVLNWFNQALLDLEELTEFIADDNPDAARKLYGDVIEKARQLPLHPRLYRPGRLPGTREMVIRNNYVVIYTESPEAVTILRVLHASQQWP